MPTPTPIEVPGPKHLFPQQRGQHASLYATEWLLTSGNGGFAMGTALGANRRKYHALLIASAHPPVERLALLNALDVEVIIDPETASERRAWLAAHVWLRGGLETQNLSQQSLIATIETLRWILVIEITHNNQYIRFHLGVLSTKPNDRLSNLLGSWDTSHIRIIR